MPPASSEAFAKACNYLNYKPSAKWWAYLAGIGTGLLSVALLALLWLFVDLVVSRGRLPAFDALTPAQQATVLDSWNNLTEDQRRDRLARLAPQERLAPVDAPPADVPLSPAIREAAWRAYAADALRARVGDRAADLVTVPVEQPLPEVGLLPNVVRHHLDGSRDSSLLNRLANWNMPLLAWLARWNPWTWATRTASGNNHAFYLAGLLLLAALLALARTALSFFMHRQAALTTIEAVTRLRRAVYHHTFRLGTLAFRALGPSEALGVFTRHVEAVAEALYSRLCNSYRIPVLIGLLLLFALLIHPLLALAFLLFAVLLETVGGKVADYFARLGRAASHRAAEQLTLIRESLMLMRLVKVFGMDLFNQARVERLLARYGRAQTARLRGEAVAQPLLLLLGTLAAFVLLAVAGLLVLSGGLSAAGAITLAAALVCLYWPLQTWNAQRRVLRRGRDSAEALFRFLERPGEVGQVVGAEFLPPLHQQLEFDNVTLREPGSPTGSRLLLENVSLNVPSGLRVGLVGPDDLEKHALVYLIPRLLDPTSGEIRIDQHNLRWITLDSLRNQIAVVLQDDLTFHDTVANNIGCGDPAFTLPRIIEAAKVAHAHSFIQKLPQGYETPIGELGHPLNVSQRFRIALARAILRDPALVIIEEPQEDLDDDTKSFLDDTLARFLPGRTVLFLPHRVSTIRACDRLYLLYKGKLVAEGVHRELLAGNPLYRHLFYLEFNEVEEQIQA